MTELLDAGALAAGLDELEGWDGTTAGIHKTYVFSDFAGSVAFVNRVAAVAEDLNHHPDITIRWNSVELAIVSHSAGGVTGQCLGLARRIDLEAADS
jgi:4a-hydroxytetrahydrobiopterin dehydratase